MQTARLNSGIRSSIFFFLWLGFHYAFSQGIQKPIPKEVSTNPNGSKYVRYGYQEYLPVGYDPQSDEKWPLIIHMVGVGERGNGSIQDLDTLAGIGISKLVANGRNYPFLIMSPQPTGDQKIPLNNDTNTGKFVADTLGVFIDYVLENYNVDPDRVYITAFSAAAEQAATYIAKNPTKIAAFIPVSGNARFVKNFCNIADIPVWAFHNLDDPNIPSAGSIGFVSDLKNCNPPPIVRPKVTIYPGNRHDAWSATYNGSGMGKEIINKNYDPFDITIFDWFLKYTKNQSVVADAGPSQYIVQPEDSAALTGSSRPGTGVTYAWTQIGNTPATATLSGENTATLTVTNLTAKGEYMFELTVTDAQNNVGRDTASIFVRSFVADAGNNKTITLPTNSTTLNGKVEDAVPGETFTYRWTQVIGPYDSIVNGVPVNEKQATFSDPGAAETTISDLVVGTYKFEFEVTDNTGETARDYVEVTVRNTNDLLAANAGKDTTVVLPIEKVVLKGAASDSELNTIISYQWSQISGTPALTLTNADTPDLEITDLQPGVFIFEFKVANDNEGTAADTMVLTVEDPNAALTANAGSDTTVILPVERLEITGTGTPANKITGYQWAKISGPEATLTGTEQATLIVEDLMKGTYQFELIITDGQVQAKDTVAVFVEATNDSLAADAGDDITVYVTQESAEITGTGTDPYNEITGYQWTKLSGPEATLSGQDQATLTVSGLQEGTYEFELTVSNDNEGTAKDTMLLTVAPCEAPVINPIEDITVSQDQMPVEVPLNISGADLSSVAISAVSDNQDIISDDNINVVVEDGAAKVIITANTDTAGSANITVTVGEGCTGSEQFAITVNPVTGVKDQLEDLAVVYPNPSPGVFLLQWKEVVPKGAEISIFTTEGTLLKRFNVQENQREFTIDLNTSVKGTYLLRLKVDNKFRTYRIIKE